MGRVTGKLLCSLGGFSGLLRSCLAVFTFQEQSSLSFFTGCLHETPFPVSLSKDPTILSALLSGNASSPPPRPLLGGILKIVMSFVNLTRPVQLLRISLWSALGQYSEMLKVVWVLYTQWSWDGRLPCEQRLPLAVLGHTQEVAHETEKDEAYGALGCLWARWGATSEISQGASWCRHTKQSVGLQ